LETPDTVAPQAPTFVPMMLPAATAVSASATQAQAQIKHGAVVICLDWSLLTHTQSDQNIGHLVTAFGDLLDRSALNSSVYPC